MKKLAIKNIRHFNEIKIVDNNFVCKSFVGNDDYFKTKFFNEIIWLIKAQKVIPNLVPKVIDFSLDKNDLWIKYEFINDKTVHDFFVNSKTFNFQYWNNFINESKLMFNFFKKNKPNFFVEQEWINNIFEYQLKRPFETIKKLKSDKKFDIFWKDDFIILNNKKYPSLSKIEKYLENKIMNINLFSHDRENDCFYRLIKKDIWNRICFTHLDLVFGNIFFNLKNNNLKIIDPRGSYINSMDYGDIYYDYAKYFQSVFGLYEFIAEDKYEININIKKIMIEYNIQKPKKYEEIKKLFNSFFNDIDFEVIKLIESFQFFTMIPAHSDNYKRQLIELCVGITHFYEVVGDELWK